MVWAKSSESVAEFVDLILDRYADTLLTELCTELFYAIIPPLFLYFLPFCYPYILLHFICFLLLVHVVLAASACLSSGLPSHSSSLSQAATGQLTQALATLAVLTEDH